MKIKDLELTPDALLKAIQSISDYQGRVFFEFTAGVNSPVINVFRPIGLFETHYVHYLSKQISLEALPKVIGCLGSQCLICQLIKKLRQSGAKEAIEKADSIKVNEKNVWAVIPRGIKTKETLKPYEWAEPNKAYVMSFGKTVRKTIQQLTKDLGIYAGAVEGYDLEALVQKSSWGNKMEIRPAKRQVKDERGIYEQISVNRLTEEELNYDIPDMDNLVTYPDSELQAKIAETFSLSYSDTKRVTMSLECFGDENKYDEETCSSCSEKPECIKKIFGGA